MVSTVWRGDGVVYTDGQTPQGTIQQRRKGTLINQVTHNDHTSCHRWPTARHQIRSHRARCIPPSSLSSPPHLPPPPPSQQAWSLVSLPTELFPGYEPQPHTALLSDITALHAHDLNPARAVAASRQLLVEAAEEIGDKILPVFETELASRRVVRGKTGGW